MKKGIIFLIALSLILTDCKYKEGPLISFKRKKFRLIGSWTIKEFKSDGVDSLNEYVNAIGNQMYILEKETYSNELRIYFVCDGNIRGSVEFIDDKEALRVILQADALHYKGIGPIGVQKESEWEILKLTSNDFKVTTQFRNHDYNIHYKKIK